MKQYGKAWETFDSDAIVRIFTKNGTYQETPLKKPYRGHREIKRYWKDVVHVKEKNVKFTLGKVYVIGDVGIAEWKSKFTRRDNKNLEELRGIILAEVQKGKIKKLWEYWHKKEYMM